MPTCRDVAELATDFTERALPLRDWLGMRFHLSRCQDCRNYMEQLRKTVALLRDRSLPGPDPEATERMVAAARKELGNDGTGDA